MLDIVLQSFVFTAIGVSNGISATASISPRQYHTVHYVDYIIWARLRHKVTRFVAHEAVQIEFILCEFPEHRLVKTTPTASRVSVSAANIVPEQPDCHTQIYKYRTHTHTHTRNTYAYTHFVYSLSSIKFVFR